MKSKYLAFILVAVLAIIALAVKRCNSPGTKESPGQAAAKTGNKGQGNGRGLNRNTSILFYSKHAKCRMECRHISQKEVEQILEEGSINYKKSDLQDSRGPEYAVEGLIADGQKVRIVFAPRKTQTTVITVIDLENEWTCPSCN